MDNSIAFPVQLQRRVAGCDLVILLYMRKNEEFPRALLVSREGQAVYGHRCREH